MAYTSWSSSAWVKVWDNTKYKIEVEWSYRQNPVTNKTQYRVTRIRVTSLTAYHSFYTEGASTVGIGTNKNGAPISGYSVNVPIGGSATIDLPDVQEEVSHEADGSLSDENTCYVYGYFDAGLGAQNSYPTGGWNKAAASIPTIDRGVPVTTAEVDSIGAFDVSLKVSSNTKTQYARYSIDDGATWEYVVPPTELQVTNGGTGVITLTGFKPDTDYTLIWQVRRDYNEVWSDRVTVTFTTLSDQESAYIKVNGAWKKAKVWLKNETLKKVKKAFIKNDIWRK